MNKIIKLVSFLLSLLPLFIILVLWNLSLSYNYLLILLILFIICIIIIYFVYTYIKRELNQTPIKVQINEITLKNEDYLWYFVTYLVPFITLKLTDWKSTNLDFSSIFVLLFVTLIMWLLYLKTRLYMVNPVLWLVWFHLYEVVISKDGESKKCLLIGRKNYKRVKEEEVYWYYIEEDEAFFIITN